MDIEIVRENLKEIEHLLPWYYAGCNTVVDVNGDEVANPYDLAIAELLPEIVNAVPALLDEINSLRKQLEEAEITIAANNMAFAHNATYIDEVTLEKYALLAMLAESRDYVSELSMRRWVKNC